MHTEDDLLPISALQHMEFCPRQCALIHIERLWSENRLTAQGRIMHDKVHDSPGESRGDLYIARGLRLRSMALGLSGQADVVEFHLAAPDDSPECCTELTGRPGRWIPLPVEYKRGKPKRGACDKVQLCAQAICLEEMLGVSIARGALFYGKTRRRLAVEFDAALRTETHATARRVHEMFAAGITPPPNRTPACKNCSMEAFCLPCPVDGPGKAAKYVARTLKAIAGEAAETKGTGP